MENTTKALYMVVGVILGLLILTAFVWVFRNGGQFLSVFTEKGDTKQIEEYNSELLGYIRENNTIYDVITACNLAYDINKQYDYDNENHLEIEINGLGNISGNNFNYDKGQSEVNRLKSGQIYNVTNNPVQLNLLLTNPIPGTTDTLVTLLDQEDVALSGVPADLENNERKYKYIFEGTIQEYNNIGKIKKIRFECQQNSPDPVTGKYK